MRPGHSGEERIVKVYLLGSKWKKPVTPMAGGGIRRPGEAGRGSSFDADAASASAGAAGAGLNLASLMNGAADATPIVGRRLPRPPSLTSITSSPGGSGDEGKPGFWCDLDLTDPTVVAENKRRLQRLMGLSSPDSVQFFSLALEQVLLTNRQNLGRAKRQIRESDIVLVDLTILNRGLVIGVEIAYASLLGKAIVMVVPEGSDYRLKRPGILELADYICSNVDEAFRLIPTAIAPEFVPKGRTLDADLMAEYASKVGPPPRSSAPFMLDPVAMPASVAAAPAIVPKLAPIVDLKLGAQRGAAERPAETDRKGGREAMLLTAAAFGLLVVFTQRGGMLTANLGTAVRSFLSR